MTPRPLFVLIPVLAAGCAPDLSLREEERLRAMEAGAAQLPPSPTNAYADDVEAAALGRLFFFDERMSSNGEVACANCHDPERGFSDDEPVSIGVEDRRGDRHSMPVMHVGMQRFFLWDGRADSLWSQPLKALENEAEMNFTRAEVAHFVEAHHAADYEATFGPLPDLAAVPARAKPGTPEWDGLDGPTRDAVQRVFVNVGKAMAAYERRLLCLDTRFDQWARGELTMTAQERAGAAVFIREGCIDCHSGPAFTDGAFHNIGIGSGTNEPDVGRASARELLLADRFNGAGPYSDDPDTGAALLASIEDEPGQLGAFRTPSLRGVSQRGVFGHRGHLDLAGFLDHYDDPELEDSAVGELDPLAEDVELDDGPDVAAFLAMLSCPPLPAELLSPYE